MIKLTLPHFCYYDHDISVQQAIYQIEDMPDLVMRYRYKVLINSDKDFEKILSILRTQYKYQSRWLEFFLLGNNNILSDLSPKQHAFKSIANLSIATLKLCQVIAVFTTWTHQKYLNPIHWFLSIEQELCEQILSGCGLTGEPKSIGKSKFYKNCVTVDRTLQSNTHDVIQVNSSDLKPVQALEGIGSMIAAKNVTFRNGAWKNYCQAIKRSNRELRDSDLEDV